MKKNSQRMKEFPKRLLAMLICCCLLAAIPMSVMAVQLGESPSQTEEGSQTPPAAGSEGSAPEEKQLDNQIPGGQPGSETGGETGVQPGSETGGETGVQPGSETGGETGGQPGSETGGETGAQPGSETGGETGVQPGSETGGETGVQPGSETGGEPGGQTGDEPGGQTGDEPGSETGSETIVETNVKMTAPLISKVMRSENTLNSLALEPETEISTVAIGDEESVTLKIGESVTIKSGVTDTSADRRHQESWTSRDEAVAKVDFTLDDGYKATSATVTGVTPGTATITHTYYIPQDYYGYTYLETQTETIQVTVYAQEYTVTFDVGAEAIKAGVTAPSAVTVTEGQTISVLPEPVWKDGEQFAFVFAGWYTDENFTTEFTSTTAVSVDTVLYAKWVEPEADGVYYVNFYSQDGQTVHLTLSAMAGKTVAPAQGPTLTDKVFVGWSITKQGERPAADLVKFNFDIPISDVAEEGANGKTLNLYAWYANSVTVSFIANGGTAVPSQIIAEGDTATSGQTTRTGYTFRGWSTNADEYTEFSFDTPVNGDLTLYAFWDADLVPVTIVYMYEHADDAEYSPAGKSAKIYAPAGSYISVEKSAITRKDQTHAVRYADTINGELTGYAKQSDNTNGSNATIPDISDTYYQYDSATNKRWVNPDGSTTILVYYNRARVTLTFAYNQSDTTASIDYEKLISEANRTKYDVNYSSTGDSNFTYSFTAKYGEDITAVWPQVAWVKDDDGNAPSYTSGSGYWKETNTFYAWLCPDKTPQSSNMYTLEANLFGNNDGLSIVNGKLVGTGSLPDVFKSVKKDWLIYARTTLPGESVDFTYNKMNYTIYKEACQLGYTDTGTFRYKSLNGCTPISGTPELYDEYGSNMSIGGLSVNKDSSLKAKFDETFPNQISGRDNCQVLLYDRNKLTLSVWTKDDTHSNSDPQNANYLYGDKIYNEDTDLLKSLEETMKKEGYVFAGWYTASEFTPGTEYKPDENSVIRENMNLYAKWEPNAFRAEYYLYTDDAAPYARQGFAEGGKIDDKLVPSAVQDSFLGWYWYQNGHLVPFDFTSAVGANHVDEDGVLKLYAKWSGNNGRVSYLPGIGGDNANQEVVEVREFAINEASVQLPQYTNVWGSGVPTDTSLTFVGWKAPNGVIYQPGRYVLVTRNLMQFEAQWSADPVQLIYNANGGVGDNVTEYWARNSVVSVWDNMDGTAPHFTRENYTLLGWDTDPNATTPTYQLGQGSITLSEDSTTLYAIWKLNAVNLTIKKTVSGNMYNENDTFPFTLSYEGGTQTFDFTLKNGEERTFVVPVGAMVTVTEDLENSHGYVPSATTESTVKFAAVLSNEGIFKFTMPDQNAKLVINNDKTVTIDTGISLETVPYILILAVVVIGAVLMMKNRRNREDD